MNKKIDRFRGENYFLSNFYMAPITYEGITYTNNEAAFQAQKCENPEGREAFANLNPSEAKKIGRHVHLRKDWESVKRDIMYNILLNKFKQNPMLRLKLQATGDAYLEEGNNWGDFVWGTVKGIGENRLGKLLMQVREELHTDMELIVLERENGWYGGYLIRNDQMEQVFNTDNKVLFHSIKNYTDKGYTVTCLSKSHEKEFMENRPTLEVNW